MNTLNRSLALLLLSAAWAPGGAVAASLITDGALDAATLPAWGRPATSIRPVTTWNCPNDLASCVGPKKNMACFTASGFWLSHDFNVSLKTNTRYRLSFDATAAWKTVDYPVSTPLTLRYSVRQPDPYAYVFMESTTTVLASGPKRYSFDFNTPTVDVYGPVLADGTQARTTGVAFTKKLNIFFYSDAAADGTQNPSDRDICLANVALEEVPQWADTNVRQPTDVSTIGRRSYPEIRVNQIGYGPNAPVRVTFLALPPGAPWKLVYADTLEDVKWTTTPYARTGTTVASQTGTYPNSGSTLLKKDPERGDAYYYSITLNAPPSGYYAINDRPIQVEASYYGARYRSPAFSMATGKGSYGKMRIDALDFFRLQRAGEDVTAGRYPRWRSTVSFDRRAGHTTENATCFSGNDLYGNAHTGCPGYSFNVKGGWYDAADHGKYVVNAAASLWTLQNLIERLQVRGDLSTRFTDGSLRYLANNTVPNESNATSNPNQLSDLLDETAYEIDWMLRMQIPAGTNLDMDVPVGQQDVAANVTTVATYTGPDGGSYKKPALKLTMTRKRMDGMVFHAVHDQNWTNLPTAPQSDTQPRVLDYPTTAATLSLAAIGGQCYRIWDRVARSTSGTVSSTARTRADACLNAAKLAWSAAQVDTPANYVYRYGEYSNGAGQQMPAINNGGGAYADGRLQDQIAWAGMELFLAEAARLQVNDNPFSSASVLADAKAAYLKPSATNARSTCTSRDTGITSQHFPVRCYSWISAFRWGDVAPFGTLSALTARKAWFDPQSGTIDATTYGLTGTVSSPRVALTARADALVALINAHPFRAPFNGNIDDYGWGSNADVIAAGVLLGAAFEATGTTAYRDAAGDVMNYLLGHNALNRSFITGYGTNPPMNPHHRMWAKHASIGFQSPPPGVMVGGPNGAMTPTVITAQYDSNGQPTGKGQANFPDANLHLLQTLPGCMENNKVYGMYCYADDFRSFQSNEVALNWNAPLVWLANFLDEKGM